MTMSTLSGSSTIAVLSLAGGTESCLDFTALVVRKCRVVVDVACLEAVVDKLLGCLEGGDRCAVAGGVRKDFVALESPFAINNLSGGLLSRNRLLPTKARVFVLLFFMFFFLLF